MSEVNQRIKTLVYLRDQAKCFYCGKKLKKDEFNLDHFIPKSMKRKSADNRENLVVCCPETNTFFDNMHPAEKIRLTLGGPRRRFDCNTVKERAIERLRNQEREKIKKEKQQPSVNQVAEK